MTQMAKALIAATTMVVLTTGVWGQNLLPGGDFEGTLPSPPPGAPSLPAEFANGAQNNSNGANVVDPWTTVSTGTFGSTQAGQVRTTFSASGFATQDLNATPQSPGLTNNTLYDLVFQATGTVPVPAITEGLQVTFNGTVVNTSSNFVLVGGTTYGVSNADLTSGVQTYFIRFLSNGVNALNIRGIFASAGGLGTAAILIDNISVTAVVPELNAQAGAAPLCLMLGALLLAYDQKKRSALGYPSN